MMILMLLIIIQLLQGLLEGRLPFKDKDGILRRRPQFPEACRGKRRGEMKHMTPPSKQTNKVSSFSDCVSSFSDCLPAAMRKILPAQSKHIDNTRINNRHHTINTR